jgi:hypothetical protein
MLDRDAARLDRYRGAGSGSEQPMGLIDIEDEKAWLRRYVMRLRTILRFAVDDRVALGQGERCSTDMVGLSHSSTHAHSPKSSNP